MSHRVGCLLLTLALAACGGAKDQRAAEWGCGPVQGLAAITGEKAPAWIFVGELTETAEAPAAFADIACHVATDGRQLFVGVTDYAGGATDAETKMLASLDAMIAKGAPIVVGHIGDDGEWLSITHDKTKAEKVRASMLSQQVAAAGAKRALLLVPHAAAIVAPIAPVGERFAGFTPMPVFLEGGVVSLEIAPYPAELATGPEIRIYATSKDGFDGLLALTSLTRPSLAVVMPLHDERSRDPAIKTVVPVEERAMSPDADPATALNRVPTQLYDWPISPDEYKAAFDHVLQSLPARAPD